MKEIDARGLACPAPVLETRAAVEQGQSDRIRVVVDNEAAQQNVTRFLESAGFGVSFEKSGSEFVVIGISTSAAPGAIVPETEEKSSQKIMVMCGSDSLGSGDDELGQKLMLSFLKTLKEMGPELWRLVFVNNGVKLTVTGSEILSVLQEYEQTGRQILVCGACLTHFDLLGKKEVGETTNMLDIVTAMQLADKVINL